MYNAFDMKNKTKTFERKLKNKKSNVRIGKNVSLDNLVKEHKMSKVEKIVKMPKRGTIGHFVLTQLSKNADVSVEVLIKGVLKTHPDSHFNKAHLAWYKHQIKVGRYVLPSK